MSWNMKVSYCKSNDTWMVCAYKPRKGNQINEVKYIAGRHSRAELEPIIHECEGKNWTELQTIKNKYKLRRGKK